MSRKNPRPSRIPTLASALGAILCAVAASACEGPPDPVLEVGDVAYFEEETTGLSPDRLNTLAAITAVGVAVARDEVEHLGAPLLERQRRDRLIEKIADEIALEQAGVSDEVLEARYLVSPEQELTVRHLVIRSDRLDPPSERAEARARAEEARARIVAGEPFGSVAAEVSEEPGAERTEGLLAPGREGTWVPEFWNAARRLDVGGMSVVVESEYGFHVIRLEEREIVPFERHRDEVVREVAGLLSSRAEREVALDSLVVETLVLDEEAVRAWREDVAADSVVGADALVLAEWPGSDGDSGHFTVADLERYRISIPGNQGERIHAQPEAAIRDFVIEGARETLLAEHARAAGFEVSPLDEARLLAEWSDRVTRWATAFGFAPGQDVETVKEHALAGLDGMGQELAIARAQLQEVESLLLAAWPVTMRVRAFGETAFHVSTGKPTPTPVKGAPVSVEGALKAVEGAPVSAVDASKAGASPTVTERPE